MNETPLVSIICLTFNQEAYIRDAMESFLMQKTSFLYEIIVHDDASTDHTREILREFENRYPDRVRLILQEENQYSKGKSMLLDFALPQARGSYIAFCEGDDYWTDPDKLQKQIDALSGSDAQICTHAVSLIDTATGKRCGQIAPAKTDCTFSTAQVVEGGGDFVGTCSIVMKREAFENDWKFCAHSAYDYILQIEGSMRGGMLYLAEEMGAYRVSSEGSWSKRTTTDPKAYYKEYLQLIGTLELLKEDAKHSFDQTLQGMIDRYIATYYYLFGFASGWKENQFYPYYRQLSFGMKLSLFIKHRTPILYKVLKKAGL